MVDLSTVFEANFARLQIYLQSADSGFILLCVNEEEIKKYISDWLKTEYSFVTVYELYSQTLQDTMKQICGLEHKERYLAVCRLPENTEETNEIFTQLNLMRDMIVQKNIIYLFLAPAYTDLFIAEHLPNFYDYLVVKQEYLRDYKCIFNAILPESNYLITKVEYDYEKKYYVAKQPVISKENRETDVNSTWEIYRDLDFYCRIKQNQENLSNFVEFKLEPFLKKLLQTEQGNDTIAKLLLKTAKMFRIQKDYGRAGDYYHRLDKFLHERGNQRALSSYESELLKGQAYNFYYMKAYSAARERYEKLVTFYENEENTYQQCLSYICIAACEMEQKNYFEAEGFLEKALNQEKTISVNTDRLFFAYIYNSLEILIHSADDRLWYRYHDLLKEAENKDFMVMERAMYLTMCGWIEGIKLGRLEIALKSALEALRLKRLYFIEDDIRIADSHYVIAVLYYMKYMDDHAAKCCQKCLTILSKHAHAANRICAAKWLEKRINDRKSHQT